MSRKCQYILQYCAPKIYIRSGIPFAVIIVRRPAVERWRIRLNDGRLHRNQYDNCWPTPPGLKRSNPTHRGVPRGLSITSTPSSMYAIWNMYQHFTPIDKCVSETRFNLQGWNNVVLLCQVINSRVLVILFEKTVYSISVLFKWDFSHNNLSPKCHRCQTIGWCNVWQRRIVLDVLYVSTSRPFPFELGIRFISWSD